ncbi:hypothetical protein [Humidesulfovibrio mexicanus]|nr:hypothetical protein [Humidesulfovibrio mexicanus]
MLPQEPDTFYDWHSGQPVPDYQGLVLCGQGQDRALFKTWLSYGERQWRVAHTEGPKLRALVASFNTQENQ